MELRRICKHNYAVSHIAMLCCLATTCLYSLLYYNAKKIYLDIFKIYGIIILTHNAVMKEDVSMANPPRNDSKEKILRDCGALNTHPVADPLFSDNDFFDSRDLVQVKYEMLRRVHKEGESVSRSAALFGFSRPSFYKSSVEFEREGIAGLMPRKRGPRSGHKLTAEVLAFVEGSSSEEQPTKIPALLDEVEKRFGIRVHRRSLERALRQPGKKTLQIPGKKGGAAP